MIRLVRIAAEALNSVEHYQQLHFDVLLDEHNRVWDDQTIFGLQGSLNAKSSFCAPFVVYENGSVDWGDLDKETSSATLDLRSRPLERETRLELFYNGTSHPYRITRLFQRLKGDNGQ
jgi:hypothetical protein